MLTENTDFEIFWAIYPKQRAGSKVKAMHAYNKAISQKRATPGEIYDGVERYRESNEVATGYAKGCAAWLNDDRWENDYKPAGYYDKKPKPSYLDSLKAASKNAIDSISRELDADNPG